jgi:hypothetical protein
MSVGSILLAILLRVLTALLAVEIGYNSRAGKYSESAIELFHENGDKKSKAELEMRRWSSHFGKS